MGSSWALQIQRLAFVGGHLPEDAAWPSERDDAYLKQ
jgi:hypothetical protein